MGRLALVPECQNCSDEIAAMCPEYTTHELVSFVACKCPGCGGAFMRVIPHYRKNPHEKHRLLRHTATRTRVPATCLVLHAAKRFSQRWTCGGITPESKIKRRQRWEGCRW